jgi:3-O-methylgallate 3,4-dioxygenase
MAKVIAGIGTSHGPQLKTPPAQWPERAKADRRNSQLEFRRSRYDFAALKALREDYSAEIAPEVMERRYLACQDALDRLSEFLTAAAPDLLVIVSSDHKELWDDDLLAPFTVFWGPDVAHEPFTEADLAGMAPGLAASASGDVPDHSMRRPCHPGVARHLIDALGADGYDVAASQQLPVGRYRNHSLPHGWGYIYQRILGQESTIPFVPVAINTFFEPNPPSAARCYGFGQAIGHALDCYPQDLRVAVVASGGLSHFVIDEDLDRAFLDALKAADVGFMTGLDAAIMRSGSSELRSWIAVAGIAAEAGLSVDSVDYQPCYRSEAGTGNAMSFVTWVGEPEHSVR